MFILTEKQEEDRENMLEVLELIIKMGSEDLTDEEQSKMRKYFIKQGILNG